MSEGKLFRREFHGKGIVQRAVIQGRIVIESFFINVLNQLLFVSLFIEKKYFFSLKCQTLELKRKKYRFADRPTIFYAVTPVEKKLNWFRLKCSFKRLRKTNLLGHRNVSIKVINQLRKTK